MIIIMIRKTGGGSSSGGNRASGGQLAAGNLHSCTFSPSSQSSSQSLSSLTSSSPSSSQHLQFAFRGNSYNQFLQLSLFYMKWIRLYWLCFVSIDVLLSHLHSLVKEETDPQNLVNHHHSHPHHHHHHNICNRSPKSCQCRSPEKSMSSWLRRLSTEPFRHNKCLYMFIFCINFVSCGNRAIWALDAIEQSAQGGFLRLRWETGEHEKPILTTIAHYCPLSTNNGFGESFQNKVWENLSDRIHIILSSYNIMIWYIYVVGIVCDDSLAQWTGIVSHEDLSG